MSTSPVAAELFVARFDAASRERWAQLCERFLAAGEVQRAARIEGPDERVAHVVGRAILRIIGASASSLTPERIRVENRDGRPVLRDLPRLRTNITHTGRLVAVAACDGVDIGVDAEAEFEPEAPLLRLANRLFAPEEARHLHSLPASRVASEFRRYWTLKEAVGKALGYGMVPALAGAVARPREDGIELASVWAGPAAEQWSLHQFQAPGGAELITVAAAAPDISLSAVHVLSVDDLIGCRPLGLGSQRRLDQVPTRVAARRLE